jgi:hypothetical protein
MDNPVAVQLAHPLVIPKPVYRRGICLPPAAKQQIPRATMPRFGATIPLEFFKSHDYEKPANLVLRRGKAEDERTITETTAYNYLLCNYLRSFLNL